MSSRTASFNNSVYRWHCSYHFNSTNHFYTTPLVSNISGHENQKAVSPIQKHIISLRISNSFRCWSYSSPYNRPWRPKGGVRVQLYSFFNLDAKWGFVVNVTPRPLYPQERAGTYCTRGWVRPRAGLDGCGRSHPHRDSIAGPSSQLVISSNTVSVKLEQELNCSKSHIGVRNMTYYLKYETGLTGFCFPGPDLWKLDKSASGSHLWYSEQRITFPTLIPSKYKA